MTSIDVELTNITKRFGNVVAVNDVSFGIRKGEFFTVDGFDPRDPIFEAIGGVGIVAGAEEEGEE